MNSISFKDWFRDFIWKLLGININTDVWISVEAFIITGISITKNIRDYTVVAGVSTTNIKYKYDVETVKNTMVWWDYNIDKIKKNIFGFYNCINTLITKY